MQMLPHDEKCQVSKAFFCMVKSAWSAHATFIHDQGHWSWSSRSAGQMFMQKVENKHARSWNSNSAAAAHANRPDKRLVQEALGYCEVKLLYIARGLLRPKIASGAILEGLKFLASTLHVRVQLPCTVLSTQLSRRTSSNELPSPLLMKCAVYAESVWSSISHRVTQI